MLDDPLALAILLVAGLAMGAINNLAGAAGALGLIAFEEAAGLDPVTANASLRVAAVAIGICGVLGFRSRGQAAPLGTAPLALLAIPGGLLGALAAVTLPVWFLRGYLAAVMIALLVQQFRRRAPAAAAGGGTQARLALAAFLVGLHMGFVQVGTGLVAILLLSALHGRDLLQVNRLKLALVIASSIAALLLFTVHGSVAWTPGLVLALGAGAGSWWASRWSVAKGHAGVRVVVITIAALVLVWLAWQVIADQLRAG